MPRRESGRAALGAAIHVVALRLGSVTLVQPISPGVVSVIVAAATTVGVVLALVALVRVSPEAEVGSGRR